MREIVSLRQLRAALMRWTIMLVPGIFLLGYLSQAMAGIAAKGGRGGDWLARLSKPAICPSSYTLVVIWGICFALMGLALAIMVEARGAHGRSAAIGTFALKTIVSLAWAPVLFGMHRISWAFGLLCLLAVLIVLTIAMSHRVRGTVGVLLLPCLIWVIFLGGINWQLLTLNPEADGIIGGAAAVRLRIGA